MIRENFYKFISKRNKNLNNQNKVKFQHCGDTIEDFNVKAH